MKLIYRLILNNLKDTNKVVSLALLSTFFELLYFVFARNLISQATNDINNQITFSYFSNPLFVLIGFLVTNFISLNFRSYSTKINILFKSDHNKVLIVILIIMIIPPIVGVPVFFII